MIRSVPFNLQQISPTVDPSGVTLSEALQRPAFWTLTASIALAMLGDTVVLVYQVAYVIDRGYDAMLAATLAGMLGLASLPGRYALNILSDRIAPHKLLGMSVIAQVVGVVVLMQAPTVGWLVVYVVLYGAAQRAISPLRAAVMADRSVLRWSLVTSSLLLGVERLK